MSNEPSIGVKHLDPEDAETSNVEALERYPSPGSSETSVLPGSSGDRLRQLLDDKSASERPKPTLKSVAQRVRMAKQLSTRTQLRRHLRTQSSAADVLSAMQHKAQLKPEDAEGQGSVRAEPLYSGVMEKVLSGDSTHPELDEEEDEEEEAGEELQHEAARQAEEMLPLHPSYGSVSSKTPKVSSRHLSLASWKRLQRGRWCYTDPRNLLRHLRHHLVRSPLLWFALPMFVMAWVLFYGLGNPELDFLPGARVSWYLNFMGRQLVVFELARLTQYIVIDGIVLSRLAVKIMGPVLVFFMIQSKGWPFIATAWGVWDLLVLHGDNPFPTHWFYWTGLRIYSLEASSGVHILYSNLYLRILLSMIISGVATACKRTLFSIRFGRRQLTEFKPKLEKLLKDIVLVSEIALIAQEADALVTESGEFVVPAKLENPKKKGLGTDWHSVRFEEEEESDTEGADNSGGGTAPQEAIPRELSKTRSGSFTIKELLDRWEEPVSRSDREAEQATIHDVLKFRRLLQFIDQTHPFGEAFGPSADRNECIQSSHSIYRRLLKLTPDQYALPFETLTLGAVDENDEPDEAKIKALRRVFRPDAKDRLPVIAFIQSIDSVYKRLRYFRASVANASVIDEVLLSTVNGIFYFVLALVLLSFLNFNPWPLLVSMTSLLVSVSFALGSSLSKYVEGVLLIAVRRPFDLGDRILMTGAEVVDNPGAPASWFVEDISLFFTTLRYARTNEVATVNNWSISASRIVNCNRSPNAIVVVSHMVHIAVLEGGKLAKFQAGLHKYVSDNPRIWDSLVFCRQDSVDADMEQVNFTLAFRHRNSWQDAGRILLNRGELLRFIYATCKQLGISYDTPPNRRLLYYGGVLEQGQVQDYKINLLTPKNIRSHKRPDDSHSFETAYPEGAFARSAGSLDDPLPGS